MLEVVRGQFVHVSVTTFYVFGLFSGQAAPLYGICRNIDGDVGLVCLVNRLVSLTSCGMWVVQMMQRECGAVHLFLKILPKS